MAQQTASDIPDLKGVNDPTDKQLVIRHVTPDIITFSKPFSRGGVFDIGGRTTAVKLPTNEIFVYVSTPHSPATAETLARFGGPVKWLVTPDGEHGMYIEEYTKAYPDAKAIGVSRFKERKPQINWAGLFGAGGETQQYGFEPHITLLQVSAHLNDELAAIHHASKTLIQGDLLFNLPATEQYSRVGGLGFLTRMLGGGGRSMSPDGGLHKTMIGRIYSDQAKARRELAPFFKMDFDRIIPCHGDVIETGGKEAFKKLYSKFV